MKIIVNVSKVYVDETIAYTYEFTKEKECLTFLQNLNNAKGQDIIDEYLKSIKYNYYRSVIKEGAVYKDSLLTSLCKYPDYRGQREYTNAGRELQRHVPYKLKISITQT